jgi:hypothetical protein
MKDLDEAEPKEASGQGGSASNGLLYFDAGEGGEWASGGWMFLGQQWLGRFEGHVGRFAGWKVDRFEGSGPDLRTWSVCPGITPLE